ncbi:imidazolonepropionase [Sphingobacteriales bacterium UPWRP_1]|nr:imidazolonepropionase [Sphingobacteriales bacterium TSM_CSS]PSJ77470.1 imidazolonepropionase [Sphingobacteriales bacterium UPWRP_1]
MQLLIKNIATLVQVEQGPPALRIAGKNMQQLPVLENAFLLMESGRITDFGPMDECPSVSESASMIDAKGKMVFPCWCDSHTHLVYAGSREQEFVYRIKGMTYEEIARQGGGILNSARLLQQTPEEELYNSAMERLAEITRYGTGAVEIKSGYGLSFDSELKMLRVIKEMKKHTDVEIKATFLGAHAIPLQYKANRQAYIAEIIQRMLPAIALEGLADYIDVFCDTGFYTVAETEQILEAGGLFGLKPKIHANELAVSGGVQVGVQRGAISVDHLEQIGQAEIDCLLGSPITMPTLLPGTAFFLNIPYAPARQMIDAGLPVCLASDYNPGSTPSGRMSFVLSLACLKLQMLPEEAIHAATINGACAMELQQTHGSICRGKVANVFITKPMPSVAFLPYAFGSNLIETVILKGKVVETTAKG